MLWMLSRCRPWRQHSDNTGTKHILLTKKLDMFATRSKLVNVVWMLSPETTFGQNKCFWPFSKAENTYFEPKKGEKHFFCPNVVSMLSQCCLQRQHSDNICILFENLGHVCTSQPKLSECCLQRQHSDNICKDFFCGKSWICLQLPPKVVWMLSPETTFKQHSDNTTFARKNFCGQSWICLQLAAKVVWMLSPETTFRQHLGSIQITLARNIFLKNLGHVCNSQPMLLDGPVQINSLALTNCVVDLYVPPKPTCILMQARKHQTLALEKHYTTSCF